MTPILIEIMLWYHCRFNDFCDGDLSPPAVKEGLATLCAKGMLIKLKDKPTWFKITEKGTFYVKALCNMPTPVEQKIYVIPTEPKD